MLIQNFQECLLYFQNCIAPRNLSLKRIPHDTTTVNQQREIFSGYLQTGNCKIKLKRSALVASACRAPFIAETPARETLVLSGLSLRLRTCLQLTATQADKNLVFSQGPKLPGDKWDTT